ncbi:protein phosphatase 2C domain-containing protein [Oceanobacillus sojae]|uniref:protein phosphatase 2C domain-containing protein n=1 Tax=Oceanobacillus sojae TaxID=582851 RepID=UPI0021A3ADC0|nr:protein phosphatase 2C domain-containing protein [Oceanobacillus sojae]MCT1902090.1 protein phosphatase 2C domain-containing protein [Oceanobacillus sojae]
MIHFSRVYKQGSNPTNEDAYVVNQEKELFAVIDGATGLGGLPGKIAAETIQNGFDTGDFEDSLIERISKGNTKLAKKTKQELGQGIEEITKEKRSACGIAAIQIHENYMEYAQSGDCMIFVAYQDGGIQSLSYDHVMRLDKKAIFELYNAIDKRINPEISGEAFQEIYQEEKERIIPILKANREKLNTRGGYSIIDGTAEAMEYLTYGRIPLHQVEKILLLTDGMQLHGMEGDVWKDSANFAFKHGIDSLLDYVVQQEEADIFLKKYPRLKHADDKTGILVELS